MTSPTQRSSVAPFYVQDAAKNILNYQPLERIIWLEITEHKKGVMGEELKGRFTGSRPQRLDRVIQQFISSQNDIPNVPQAKIREWIAAGTVEIDGTVKRQFEAEVQPGSFVKVKIPE